MTRPEHDEKPRKTTKNRTYSHFLRRIALVLSQLGPIIELVSELRSQINKAKQSVYFFVTFRAAFGRVALGASGLAVACGLVWRGFN